MFVQVRNLAAALLLSHGVPMFVMGDEYGHSKVRREGWVSAAAFGTFLTGCLLSRLRSVHQERVSPMIACLLHQSSKLNLTTHAQ